MSAAVSVPQRIRRAGRIGTTFGRVYLGIKANQALARRLDREAMTRRWSRFNRNSAEAIYATALDLRGLILKGCQFLGSRADVLPTEYVEVLSQLQDRVPAHPFSVVREVVERELGRPLDSVFAAFSEDPIASASLAQVHDARLRDGRRVAVKVQYPEIATLVRSDLSNLRALFRAVGVIEREVELMPLIDELATHVPRELDFLNEGRNAETVAHHFAKRPEIAIPRIHWEYSSRQVLVMEYMEGLKITDVDGLRRSGADLDAIARSLIEIFCEQIFVHGFFHADPHPGNILVQPEGPRIVLLDFGLSKELPSHFRKGVLAFVGAMFRDDPKAMAEALVDLGFETREGTAESLQEVAAVILEMGHQLRTRPYLDRRSAGRAGDEIQDIVRRNPIVRIPSHLVLLGRVLGLLSGVSRSMEADVNLLRIVLPFALGSNPPPADPNRPD